MSYEVRVVRTKRGLEATTKPITKADVDELIANDPELAWSTESFVDMQDSPTTVNRYYMIEWKGDACFWWFRGRIRCSSPHRAQLLKLAQIARTLGAHAVGDEGEHYEVQKNLSGGDELAVIRPKQAV